MTLVPCPACAHEVSTAAFQCPQCGHPVNRGRRTKLVFVVAAAVMFGSFVLIKLINAWLR
jgi:uncharacterized paraquat-inducible protein A